MYKPHNHAVYGRDKHVTNWGQNLRKCDKFLTKRENPWYYWVSEVSKKWQNLSHVTKNGTKMWQNVKICINIQFYA